jgi:NAD(P)-dependent dehydrogenase (short-subunit alcohol dehydrogenase family)
MKIDLSGKIALVTGGATGIGKGIAIALSKANATVIITSRKKTDIQNTLKVLGRENSFGFNIDLSKKKNVKILYKKIKSKFSKVDILINNIGHTLNIKDPFVDVKKWEEVMNLNFFTTVNVTNNFIKDMKKNNWGRIINITSIAGLEISGPSTFNASKAALTAYTRSVGRQLALEKRNIVMTAVAPGVVITEKGHWNPKNIKSKHAKQYLKNRTALGRFGTMDELVGIIVFLSSEYASFFHGSILQPDGGQSRQYMAFNYL